MGFWADATWIWIALLVTAGVVCAVIDRRRRRRFHQAVREGRLVYGPSGKWEAPTD
jgi:hypothetical protein